MWLGGFLCSLEMPVPSQGHLGFPRFPVVEWFCLFVDLWVLPFPMSDCSVFGNFVITLIDPHVMRVSEHNQPLVTDDEKELTLL